MEFFGALFTLIILTTFINRYFDYRKAKLKSHTEGEQDEELQAVKQELSAVKEMVADVLLELERQNHMLPVLKSDRDKPPPPA